MNTDSWYMVLYGESLALFSLAFLGLFSDLALMSGVQHSSKAKTESLPWLRHNDSAIRNVDERYYDGMFRDDPVSALSFQTLDALYISQHSVLRWRCLFRSSLFSYSPISFKDTTTSSFSSMPISWLEFLSSWMSSLFVLLAVTHSNPVVVSWLQFVAYLTAAVCLLGSERIDNYILERMDSNRSQILKYESAASGEPRKHRHLLIKATMIPTILFASWTLSSITTSAINAVPPPLPSTLDTF